MKKIQLIVCLLLLLGQPAAADAIDANRLYQDYCSVCHGDKGDGKSHARQGLVPPPRDFTSRQAALELSPARIRHAIREGVPGTAMSAWKTRLSDAQITALAELIQDRFLPESTTTASAGSRIYAEYCSVCHGDNGRGAIWATAGLSPRPVDFSSADFQAGMTRVHMIQSVTYGRPDTAMTGWGTRLDKTQIEAVVDYVIESFMPDYEPPPSPEVHIHADGHSHTHADPNAELAVYMQKPLADGIKGDSKRGAALYRQNCATCHGDNGDGKGPRAYFINPKPRNFLHAASRASLNRPTLFRIVARGKLRTEMPAWEKVFDDQQIADVSEYVFERFIRP